MRRIAIYFLEFDDENTRHVARHRVTPEEIEQITGNDYVTARNRHDPENRIRMIGHTNGGRVLTVVLEATRDDGVWRPVSAWDSKPEERGLLIAT
jgi:uncharacterized DUF497 family protein